MTYTNVNDFIVIAADDRDPYVSWENHVERGSLGGVDCVAPLGTPVYAPGDCTTTNQPNNGTGGNTVTMDFGGGWRDQFMHLSRLVDPGPKRLGELVGYSGDTGSPGQPHVHWHRIDPSGVRRNPWDYFTASTAGGDVTPIIEQETEDDMKLFWVGNDAYLSTAAGVSDPLTPISYRLFFRLINSNQKNDPQGNGVPQELFTDAERKAIDETLRSIR